MPNFGQNNDEEEEAPTEEIKTKRSEIKQQLLNGQLEEEKFALKLNKTRRYGYVRYKPKSTNARYDEPIIA